MKAWSKPVIRKNRLKNTCSIYPDSTVPQRLKSKSKMLRGLFQMTSRPVNHTIQQNPQAKATDKDWLTLPTPSLVINKIELKRNHFRQYYRHCRALPLFSNLLCMNNVCNIISIASNFEYVEGVVKTHHFVQCLKLLLYRTGP